MCLGLVHTERNHRPQLGELGGATFLKFHKLEIIPNLNLYFTFTWADNLTRHVPLTICSIEHFKNLRMNNAEKSAIALHFWNKGHEINNSAKLLKISHTSHYEF